MHEQIAASVLLKRFVKGNERRHTNDAPSAWADFNFLNVNDIHTIIPQETYTNQNPKTTKNY